MNIILKIIIMTEVYRFFLGYGDKFHGIWNTGIPINPDSWLTQCTQLDTRSGLITIVVNGKVLLEEEIQFFRGSQSDRPLSLKGKNQSNEN